MNCSAIPSGCGDSRAPCPSSICPINPNAALWYRYCTVPTVCTSLLVLAYFSRAIDHPAHLYSRSNHSSSQGPHQNAPLPPPIPPFTVIALSICPNSVSGRAPFLPLHVTVALRYSITYKSIKYGPYRRGHYSHWLQI